MEVRIKKLLKNPYEISYGKTVAFDVFIMPSVRPRPEHVSLNVLAFAVPLLWKEQAHRQTCARVGPQASSPIGQVY